MKTLRHRNPHDAFRALRLDGLPALAHADGLPPELVMRARWSGRTSPASSAMPRSAKSVWLPRLAGLLAFGALAAGIFLAGSDTCAERGTAAAGNYSRSTLAPITTSGTGSRDGSCKRTHGRLEQSKTAP
ncbi:UNVERIFIED_ORG: hypothetical protein ABIC43_007397 [Variovorax guangxiensis]|jgi:hypothetical protein